MKKLNAFVLAGVACSLLGSCTMLRADQLTLLEGQTGKLGFQTITLLKVLDSRCPPDVQCVWAGDVLAQVRVVQGRNTSELSLRFPHDTASEWKGLRIINVTQTAPLKVTFTSKQP